MVAQKQPREHTDGGDQPGVVAHSRHVPFIPNTSGPRADVVNVGETLGTLLPMGSLSLPTDKHTGGGDHTVAVVHLDRVPSILHTSGPRADAVRAGETNPALLPTQALSLPTDEHTGTGDHQHSGSYQFERVPRVAQDTSGQRADVVNVGETTKPLSPIDEVSLPTDEHTGTGDQHERVAQARPVPRTVTPATKQRRGHSRADPHGSRAASRGGNGAGTDDTSASALPTEPFSDARARRAERKLAYAYMPLDELIVRIRFTHRMRQGSIRDFNALQNHNHAACRRLANTVLQRTFPDNLKISNELAARVLSEHPDLEFDATCINVAREAALIPLKRQRTLLDWELRTLGAFLPVYPWAASVRGFGALGLAQIIGETGDLSNYPDDPNKSGPACVNKRLGLAVIEGEAQGRHTGEKGILHGFSPQRRSVAYSVGASLMQGNGADGPYKQFYDREKARQAALHPELTPIHCHRRALRHMTKELIEDLWQAWRAS